MNEKKKEEEPPSVELSFEETEYEEQHKNTEVEDGELVEGPSY